jgi:serpin B
MKQKQRLFFCRFLCLCGLTTILSFSFSDWEKQGTANSSCCWEKKEEAGKSDRKSLSNGTISDNVRAVVRSNTNFAIDLYQQVKSTDGNLFFSPFSISIAFAMTYGGAKKKTAQEMADVLYFNVPSQHLHDGFAELLQSLETSSSETLKMANRVWLQQDFSVLNQFVALTRDAYQAPVAQLDFRGNPEEARQTINNWVAQRTNQQIQEALSRQDINSLTRFVLTNVIYFQDNWLQQFPEENTREQPFWIASDRSLSVPMMHHEISSFGYCEYPDLQILELFYQDSRLSMVILLPREIDGIVQLEQNLTASNLMQWLSELNYYFDNELAEVSLPKFAIASDFKLKDTLKAMGMRRAFNRTSDFSGISKQEELVLHKVAHKAFVKVNEQGTEAGATTSVIGGSRGIPSPIATVKIDRPFLFLIRDEASNSILFMGRVMNPLINEQ